MAQLNEESATYQIEAEKLSSLRKVPLFASLEEKDLVKISRSFTVTKALRGEVIFREGEPGDAFYIIRSGIVTVSTGKGEEEKIVTHLHRGDFFGEFALLTGESRSATVTVLLDVHLFVLSKAHFENVIRDNPLVSIHLNRILSHRLKRTTSMIQPEFSLCFYSVLGSHSEVGSTIFLKDIVTILSSEIKKRVLIIALNEDGVQHLTSGLSSTPIPDPQLLEDIAPPHKELLNNCWYKDPSGFTVFSFPSLEDKKLLAAVGLNLAPILGILRMRFDYVFFDLAPTLDPIAKRILRLSERVLFLSANTPEGVNRSKEKLTEIKVVVGESPSIISVGVSHLMGDTGLHRSQIKALLEIPEAPEIWVEQHEEKPPTEAGAPAKKAGAARRVAREIGGVRLGLALGGGGARGWAHVGILEVLEKEGIPIDMITGTSIGALVGATYAKTNSFRETYALTVGKFPDRRSAKKRIFDYTIPFKGFIKGNKILQMLKEGLEEADFLDLTIPFAAVAADISNGEEIVLDKGSVSDAVRASIAIPGIIEPVEIGGRWCVDGGLVNPVPASVLIREGIDFIIGVFLENKASQIEWDANRGPNIINILTKSFGIISTQASQGVPDLVNVAIYPKVGDFRWDDFHRGTELARIGREAAYEAIDHIKQLCS